jgi:pimeloyl-ACP methyl ester carboxylesterase
VGGVGIELWSQGKGPALLFLHPGDGFNSSARFIQTLAQNFRVLAPSHPGFGGSALPSHMRTVDDLSYFYLDLMEDGRKFAAANPSATFDVVAGVGHYPHVERANEVSAIVNRAFHGAYLNQATEKCVEKVRP